MFVVTGEEMRKLDEATISRHVPGVTLMERAGQGIFESIADHLQPLEELTISIFLGRGNNAGDGLVLARLLAEKGTKVILHYLHDPKELSPDSFKNYTRLRKLRRVNAIEENFLFLADWERKVRGALEESDLVVDALLGTGITKPVRDLYAEVIDVIYESGRLVLSVDIPSGVHATTGEIMGTAIKADLTVTMGLPKVGMLFYPGKAYTGGLKVIDIGIPGELIEEHKVHLHLLDMEQAWVDMPRKDPSSHKFQRGSLLVVAGSTRYTGAANLASLSALRTGCGVVYLAAPETIRPVIQSFAPEIIFLPQPETSSGSIGRVALERIFEEVRFDAAAVGPGLTTDAETVAFVVEFVRACPAPVLLDADGINAFAGRFAELVEVSKDKEIVISPHSGELKRLTGKSISTVPLERIEQLRVLVRRTGITLVHKGAPTVIVHPDGRGDIDSCGHPGQATAGSGDVLTGTIAGFLAQGCTGAEAARLGVFLHSKAARLAAEETSEAGMIASDCMNALARVMKEIEEGDKY